MLRASAGIYYARQNMLSQVGSVTTNGIQQKSDFRDTSFTAFADMPVWPNLLAPSAVPPGTFPLFTGVRVFDRDYRNPRIYSFNVGFERELAPAWPAYVDFTVAKGVHLTRFLNYNVHGTAAAAVAAGDARHDDLHGRQPVRAAAGRRLRDQQPRARPVPRRDLRRAQALLAASTSSKRTTCWPRTKTTTRTSAIRSPTGAFNFYDLSLDYGPSDRDIRHKFNFFTYAELPHRLLVNVRMQGRTAQPITTSPRVLNGERPRPQLGPEGQRSTSRSTGGCSARSASAASGEIIPSIEMFNTFNNANNINPLATPALFNFDGFLRQGVGDPRQVQLAVKVTF